MSETLSTAATGASAEDAQPAQTPSSAPTGAILHLSKSTIRHLEPSDAAELTRIADNPAVGRFLRDRFPAPYTRADADWWIAHNQRARPVRSFAIADPRDGRIMGCVGLEPGADVHARGAELGYWLGEEYWGRGIVGEVVPAFARWAFARFADLERIYVGVFAENTASVKVVERAGFVFEGRQRKAAFKSGRFMDVLGYSFIRDDLEEEKSQEGA